MALAIYARKSTESEERQVQSLDDQLSVLTSLARRESLKVEQVFVEARSAKEPGTRPEFERLLNAIRDGSVTGILTWEINRLGRNMVDGGHIAHLLQSGKLKFIRTPERIYRPEDSALLLAIETGVATSFIQDLRRNVIRGMEGKANRGWRPGKAPIGYKNNLLTHEIEIDPERFSIIQRGWEMLAGGGYSIADVSREMRSMGLKGFDQRKPIAQSLVYAIFHNQFYSGFFAHAGKIYKGNHPAMISRELFERVQARLGRKRRHRDPDRKHPYAGIFRCLTCNCAITAETKIKTYRSTGRTVSYTYYHCTGARGCRWGSVASPILDKGLEHLSENLKVAPKLISWLDTNLPEMLTHLQIQGDQVIRENQKEADQLAKRLVRLRDMRLDDELSQDEYLEEKTRLQELYSATQAAVSQSSSQAAHIGESIQKWLLELEQAQSWLSMSTMAKRAFLQALSSRAFLTLEKASFQVNWVLALLLALEPVVLGNQSMKFEFVSDDILGWQSNPDLASILKNIENRTIWLSINLRSGAMRLESELLSTPLVSSQVAGER